MAPVKHDTAAEQTRPTFKRRFLLFLIISGKKHFDPGAVEAPHSPRCFQSSSPLVTNRKKRVLKKEKKLLMHSSLKVLDLNNAANRKGYSATLSEQVMHSQH